MGRDVNVDADVVDAAPVVGEQARQPLPPLDDRVHGGEGGRAHPVEAVARQVLEGLGALPGPPDRRVGPLRRDRADRDLPEVEVLPLEGDRLAGP